MWRALAVSSTFRKRRIPPTGTCINFLKQRWLTALADDDCPYEILQVSRGSSQRVIKKQFLKLALVHHPDRTTGNAQAFNKLRTAFESLSSKEFAPPPSQQHRDEFDRWLAHETKAFLSFDIPKETIDEVIRVHNQLGDNSRPLNDKGGYWEMARQLAERVANHGEAATELPSGQQSGPVRRKRKR